MEFFGCLSARSRGFMEFSSPGLRFQGFRGFPGMELGIFKVAKSSGEGRFLAIWPPAEIPPFTADALI